MHRRQVRTIPLWAIPLALFAALFLHHVLAKVPPGPGPASDARAAAPVTAPAIPGAPARDGGAVEVGTFAGHAGTGDAFMGGDPRLELALATALRIDEALAAVRRVPTEKASSLCAPVRCDVGMETAHCARLGGLTDAQAAFCATFLREHAEALQTGARKIRGTLRLSELPLFAADGAGGRLSVAAMTTPDEGAPLVVHSPTFQALSPSARVALMAHELGHHLREGGKIIDDTSPVGPFASGRELLDTIGASLATLAGRDLGGARRPACAGGGDGIEAYLAGLARDTAGAERGGALRERLGTELGRELAATNIESAAQRIASRALHSPEARARAVDETFDRFLARPPTPAERADFVSRAERGTPWSSLVAAVIASPEYAQRRNATTDQRFLAEVYRDLTGASPDAPAAAAHLARLARLGRSTWVLGLLRKDEPVMAALAASWFQRFVRRPPSETETTAWTKLLASGLDWVELQSRLLGSAEYRDLQRASGPQCTAR